MSGCNNNCNQGRNCTCCLVIVEGFGQVDTRAEQAPQPPYPIAEMAVHEPDDEPGLVARIKAWIERHLVADAPADYK